MMLVVASAANARIKEEFNRPDTELIGNAHPDAGVAYAGGNRELAKAETLIADGIADLIALSRRLVHDLLFVEKFAEGAHHALQVHQLLVLHMESLAGGAPPPRARHGKRPSLQLILGQTAPGLRFVRAPRAARAPREDRRPT